MHQFLYMYRNRRKPQASHGNRCTCLNYYTCIHRGKPQTSHGNRFTCINSYTCIEIEENHKLVMVIGLHASIHIHLPEVLVSKLNNT